MNTYIKNAAVISDGITLENQSLSIESGKIAGIYPGDSLPGPVPSGSETIDACGNYISSGFIDLHMHGLLKYRIDRGAEDLGRISEALPGYGVTGFMPTVAPLPEGQDAQFLSDLSAGAYHGAQVLGFHLEGPFLSLTGALPPESLGTPSRSRVTSLIEAAKPYRTIFSISPEFEGITALLEVMTEENNIAFITHTKAAVAQTLQAIAAGARHATHFYDVFHAPDETEPGVRPCGAVEAILADPEVSVDFILDGVHVDPIAVKMAMRCKERGKICLITDANTGAGLGKGIYTFGNRKIEVAYPGAPARLVDKKTLCGSGLTLDRAVKNAVEMLGIDLPHAVDMVTANPAGVLGLKQKGAIRAGFDADMVMFDKNINVLKTWVKGKCCFDHSMEV